jgi:hypothetical protein
LDRQEPSRQNLFILLSFVGIVLLGCLFLGFWYLTKPRLYQISTGLPFVVGIGLVSAFLAVVGLFSLIVLSSRLKRDLVSAKKITVRILFPLASLIGRVLRLDPDSVRRSFIDMNNALVAASSRLVRGDRLLLLLPHCLQNLECPHRVTSEVRNCKGCGKCEIAGLIEVCDRYGIKVSIATGGTLARRVIVETRPKAIVAVACERDLTGGILDSYPIPVIGVLNERPFGPCKNTRVDIAKVRRAIDFFSVAPGGDRPSGGSSGEDSPGEGGQRRAGAAGKADEPGAWAECGGRSGEDVGA